MFVYADNAATTCVSKTALEAMLPYLTENYGNPSSLYAFGQKAAEALAGRSMSAAEGRLKSRLDTLTDGDRRAVEDAVATHPDPPNRGGPTPPFPFPSRTLPAILRTLPETEEPKAAIATLAQRGTGAHKIC